MICKGERLNGWTHLGGLMLAITASVELVAATLSSGDASKTAGAVVFGCCLIALYAASTLFHSLRGGAKRWWQRADHCAIYLLIAGTFTPFALATPASVWRWALLGSVWCLALLGVARETSNREDLPGPLPLYIGMGWVGLVAVLTLASELPDAHAVTWLVGGALFYTVGTLFYRNPFGVRHAHAIWHLFVIAGSAAHFAAVKLTLAGQA